jgi:chromosome segregation ATPase
MKNFAQVAQTVAEIDLSVENARVEALQVEMAEIDAAIETADEQSFAIERQLNNAEATAGRAVADALLAHRRPADVGPSEQELRSERDKIEAGINELNRRRAELVSETEITRSRALARVRAATSEVTSALMADAKAAAEIIAEVYASIASFQEAFGLSQSERLLLRKTLPALIGFNTLLVHRLTCDVPQPVSDLFTALESKGAALPLQLRRSVRI